MYDEVENAVEVSLPTTDDPACSVSHSDDVKDEWFCADLNTEMKHEDSIIQKSEHQIKFEAPDIKVGINIDSDDIYIKLEPLVREELQIKDEIDQSSTDGTIETSTQVEYFYCGLCNSKFTYKTNLLRHMKIHTGEKPFKCDICDFRCRQKSNLSSHIKTHTGDKLVKCSICDYICARKGHLLSHIRTHTGEKPFQCRICDYRCTQKGNLSRHIKTHTGEKPFKCDFTCLRKYSLTQHNMKTYV